MINNKIAIIGISGIFPEAENIEKFYVNLKNGKNSVKHPKTERLLTAGLNPFSNYKIAGYLDQIDQFDNKFFNISKDEANAIEPSQRILLELTVSAIENAGYSLESLKGSKTSVYIAIPSYTDYYSLIQDFNAIQIVGNTKAMSASRIAYHLDLRGAAINIDTTCSSSLVALNEACKNILLGESNIAIVGAVKVTSTCILDEGDVIGIFSKDGQTRAFDASSTGTGAGEGGGVLVLKQLDAAVKDRDNIHAIILGSAVNQDGNRSSGITAPSSKAQAEVILEAWKKASIDPEKLKYIEAHGTGTPLGDPIEIQGISDAFKTFTSKNKICAISSVKTNIGHLDHAAGIASTIKAILSLKKKKLFPSLHFHTPNPFIDFDNSPVFVNTESSNWEDEDNNRICGVSSFGLSGTNAHIILKEYKNIPPIKQAEEDENIILKISTKSIHSFKNTLTELINYLKDATEQLSTICYTLNTGRSDYNYRHCIYTKNNKQILINALSDLINQNFIPFKETEPKKNIFILSDSLLPEGIRKKLYNQYPAFQKAIDEINENTAIKNSINYFTFSDTYALYKLITDMGIYPNTVIASGIGKIVKDYISNAVTFKEAMHKLNESTEKKADYNKLKHYIDNNICLNSSIFIGIDLSGDLSSEINRITHTLVINLTPSNIFNSLKQLYNSGVLFDWHKAYAFKSYNKVEAPTYSFDRKRCWCISPSNKNDFTTTFSKKNNGMNKNESTNILHINKDVEQNIIAIWKEVLAEEEILSTDDFFELGGNSLNAVKIQQKYKDLYCVNIDMPDFYTYSTVKEISIFIKESIEKNNYK